MPYILHSVIKLAHANFQTKRFLHAFTKIARLIYIFFSFFTDNKHPHNAIESHSDNEIPFAIQWCKQQSSRQTQNSASQIVCITDGRWIERVQKLHSLGALEIHKKYSIQNRKAKSK